MKRTLLHTPHVMLTITAGLLLTVTGCGWFSGMNSDKSASTGASTSDTQGEPFITFNNKTALSFEGFRNKLKALQEQQPGIEAVLGAMPEADQERVYNQLAEGCIAEKLFTAYVTEKGLDQTAEFKERARQTHEAIDTRLYMQAFEEDVLKEATASVDKMTNADLRAYYEANREKNQMFQGDPFLKRDKAATATAKKEYAPFDTVVDMVKEVVKREKLNELAQLKLEELRKRHGVRIEAVCLQRLIVKKDPNAVVPPAQDENEADETITDNAANRSVTKAA